MLRASVVIPTRNRSRELDRCIASLIGQQMDPGEFEIIVVDNGSTDETGAVVERWMRLAGNVRRATEPVVGVSRARNTGIRFATGEVIAFVDDDVVAGDRWLPSLLETYSQRPDVQAVVGPVHLVWPGERPRWLLPGMERWFCTLDLGSSPRLLSKPEMPVGANMSLRRRKLAALGGFATELGKRGDRLLFNDDTDLFLRLKAEGDPIAYAPGALVHHSVSPSRVSRAWLVRRAYGQGISDAALARIRAGRQGPAIAAPALRGMAGAAWGWISMLASLLHPGEFGGVLVSQLARQACALGFLREAVLPGPTSENRQARAGSH